VVQAYYNPSTAKGTQRKETNEKRSRTLLLTHENKRLLAALSEQKALTQAQIEKQASGMVQSVIAKMESKGVVQLHQVNAKLEFKLKEALDRSKGDSRQLVLTTKALTAEISLLKQTIAAQGLKIGELLNSVGVALEGKEDAEMEAAHNQQLAQDAIARQGVTAKKLKIVRIKQARGDEKHKKYVQRSERLYDQMLARKKKDCIGVVGQLQTLLESTKQERGRSKEQQQELLGALTAVRAELDAVSGPIRTKKDGKSLDDNIALLTMELMTLGVSEGVVGQVEVLCCRHLKATMTILIAILSHTRHEVLVKR
jgi:hypothetical protein